MAKAEKKKLTGRKRDERVAAYIFVAPAVILLIAFLVVPMIYTVYFSGFKYQIMRPDAMKFIRLFYSNCCSLSVCTCARSCTFGFKEVPWSGSLPYHVLCTTAYIHGSYLRIVVSTLQCKSKYRSDQLNPCISWNEPDQIPE